jgi:hypothetical protein
VQEAEVVHVPGSVNTGEPSSLNELNVVGKKGEGNIVLTKQPGSTLTESNLSRITDKTLYSEQRSIS